MGMSEVTHQEVPNAELVALVRSLEASQAALVRRIEVLEHRTGIARYGRLQRNVGDYCPSPSDAQIDAKIERLHDDIGPCDGWAKEGGTWRRTTPLPSVPLQLATLDPVVHARLNSSEDF